MPGPSYDHVICVSDIHFGWDAANVGKFQQFIEDVVRDQQPDALYLIGDVVDLWRRGIASILVSAGPFLSMIEDVFNDGIDVQPVAGNHDQRFVRMDNKRQVVAERPWQWSTEKRFESGGRQFVAVHGHQGDPANVNPVRNEGLCMTSDEVAYAIAHNYKSVANGIALINRVLDGERMLDRPTIGALAHVANPGLLAEPQNRGRAKRVSDRVGRFYSDYAIHGHTHVPGTGDGWANCGSWTGPRNTYVEVRDGEVSVIDFDSGDTIA